MCIVLIYEALGAMMLLYAISLTAGNPVGKVGFTLTVFAMVLVAGPVSAAHFNPAITLAVYISNKEWRKDWDFCLLIMLAAFVGGWWGCSLAWLSLYNPDGIEPTKAGIPVSEVVTLDNGRGLSLTNVFFIEMFTTFIFVYSVLVVKTETLAPTSEIILAALAISQTLLAMVILEAQETGAALNPAVGFSLTLFSIVNYGWQADTGKQFAVYVFAPYIGGALAGIFHKGHLKAFKAMNFGAPRTSRLIG